MRFLVSAVKTAVLAAVAAFLVPAVLAVFYIWVTPYSTLMLWRMVTGERVERVPVTLVRVSPAVPAALVAAEDGQFCRHWGVDWRELALVLNDEDGPSRGASTLTMQVARNLFLWQGDSGPTAVVRKALELPLALTLERIWGKRRTLEIYLNIAEWGPDGEFGVEAGARLAFEKPAARLTRDEAAILVSILPNPLTRDASDPDSALRRKALVVARRAARADVGCLARAG